MIHNLAKIRKDLEANKSDLAFIVGNGINRYAYGENPDISWEGILSNIWKQITHNKIDKKIFEGISFTEFYDIIEFEAKKRKKSEKLKLEVANLLDTWKPAKYHKWLQEQMIKWDIPLLTTNFDRNLDNGLRINILKSNKIGFTDFYPWNVYFSNTPLNSPTAGFGVWHINGMAGYRRSIRLGLSEYISLATKARHLLHKADSIDDFTNKNQSHWNGDNTWFHIIFNKSLCIFGLALDENETFLRWLLIERMKYYQNHPRSLKKGWYICKPEELSEGKKFFMEYIGFELVTLKEYADIYEKLLQ